MPGRDTCPRLAGRHWRAGAVRLLWRGHGPGCSAAARGLGDPRGQPPGDGNRRFPRPRDGDQQGRHRRAGRRASSRSAISPKGRRSRPAISCSGIEQATYKAAVEQQRANLAKAKATEVNAALQLQRGKELVRNQNIPQSTLDQRAADEAAAQAERDAGAGAARAGANQSRLHRDPLADRWTDRTCRLHRRQPGQSLVREAGDDRQPGPDLRHLSGERARCSRLQAQGRRVGRQEPARDHSHQAAQRHHLSASRPHQLPRRPGRRHDRHRGGAGATAEPGRSSDPRRDRRRHGGTGRAALGADGSAIRRPARSGRPLRPASSTPRRRSSCGASRPASSKAATSS